MVVVVVTSSTAAKAVVKASLVDGKVVDVEGLLEGSSGKI